MAGVSLHVWTQGLDSEHSALRMYSPPSPLSLAEFLKDAGGGVRVETVNISSYCLPRVKRPQREAGQLTSIECGSAEVKNAWSYTSTPHTSSWCGA
jgi:hypothetical protein